jgi:acetyl-CoA acetyltransferase
MGGASGVVAARRAARAVQAGDADVVACVAGDANQIDSFRRLLSSFSRFSMDAAYPYGYGGPNANFALLTDAYMAEYGATREDFGRIAVAQRDNALRNPDALMKKPLTLDQYLSNASDFAESDRPCSIASCPAPAPKAFLVMREEEAVKRRGAALCPHRRHDRAPQRLSRRSDPVARRLGVDVDELYDMAGCAPGDIDLLQTYDDYPVISMMQIEDLGFCAKGEGRHFVREHDLTIDGDFPHNTNRADNCRLAGRRGRRLSRHGRGDPPGDRGGRADAGRKAPRALVSGFGMINYDRGVCSAAAIISGGAS